MPRITAEQKQRNHEQIVHAAALAFRSRGVDAVGIDEVMKASGMTHGGFYNHFPSKAALAIEVFDSRFEEALGNVSSIIDAHASAPEKALPASVDAYLSAGHRDHPEVGCPSAALVSDAARHGVDMQRSYVNGLTGYLDRFAVMLADAARADGVELAPADARACAISTFSEMVGTLMLSRAVAQADPSLADELLQMNRRHLAGV